MPKIGTTQLKPFWQTTDDKTVRLYAGDVLAVLKKLPAKSVHCVVTSPPYWGLRDYGTGLWKGGNPDCDHSAPPRGGRNPETSSKQLKNVGTLVYQYNDICLKCEAVRIDSQLGSERLHDCLGWACGSNCAERDWQTACHVCRMVLVCREIRRVLRDDGTFWLNYGDTYSGGKRKTQVLSTLGNDIERQVCPGNRDMDLQSGNLVGIPWRVALALQADGWILRQDIIWAKKSSMPESVITRCTKAHEYVFLFAKKQGYYYDSFSIREPYIIGQQNGLAPSDCLAGKNKRSVWFVASGGYPGAHFATFPFELIRPMIKAGTSEKGCCSQCGTPYVRITDEETITRERPNEYIKRNGEKGTGNYINQTIAGVDVKTVGWQPGCDCNVGVTPCTVLDPFIGSGTTCLVSLEEGRHSIGIDLNQNYLEEHAKMRLEGALLSRPALTHLAGISARRVDNGVEI